MPRLLLCTSKGWTEAICTGLGVKHRNVWLACLNHQRSLVPLAPPPVSYLLARISCLCWMYVTLVHLIGGLQ